MKEPIHKIGDVLNLNIKGNITPCVILGFYEWVTLTIEDWVLWKYSDLDWYEAEPSLWDDSDGDCSLDCYQLLIGDQKVYASQEILPGYSY